MEVKPYQTNENEILFSLQRGDEEMSEKKPSQYRLFDGMIGYLSPRMWTTKPCISSYNQGETQWFSVPYSKENLETLQECVEPLNNNVVNPKTEMNYESFRRCKSFIDFKDIAALPEVKKAEPDLLLKIRNHKHRIPVIKLKSLPTALIKDSSLIDIMREPIPETGQITAGTYLVGPNPGDNYPTFGGAGGFVAAIGANQTGRLRGINSGPITETASATTTHNRNGQQFWVTSNVNHNGNANSGHLISINHNNNWLLAGEEGVGDESYYELLNVRRIINASDNLRNLFIVNAVLDVGLFYVRNNIFDGNSLVGRLCRINDNTPAVIFYNNLLCCSSGGLEVTSANVNNIIENNSIYDSGVGLDANGQNFTATNNAVLGNTTDFANIGAATGNNNADSDGTGANGNWAVGAGNQINLVPAAQWESVVAADGDSFLKPVLASTVATQGTTPSYATTLIDGRAHTTEIGAKSFKDYFAGNAKYRKYW